MANRLAKWDDEHEAERGREAFYSDRCVPSPLVYPPSSRALNG